MWYKLDDAKVEQTTLADVLKLNAYMLVRSLIRSLHGELAVAQFYERSVPQIRREVVRLLYCIHLTCVVQAKASTSLASLSSADSKSPAAGAPVELKRAQSSNGSNGSSGADSKSNGTTAEASSPQQPTIDTAATSPRESKWPSSSPSTAATAATNAGASPLSPIAAAAGTTSTSSNSMHSKSDSATPAAATAAVAPPAAKPTNAPCLGGCDFFGCAPLSIVICALTCNALTRRSPDTRGFCSKCFSLKFPDEFKALQAARDKERAEKAKLNPPSAAAAASGSSARGGAGAGLAELEQNAMKELMMRQMLARMLLGGQVHIALLSPPRFLHELSAPRRLCRARVQWARCTVAILIHTATTTRTNRLKASRGRCPRRRLPSARLQRLLAAALAVLARVLCQTDRQFQLLQQLRLRARQPWKQRRRSARSWRRNRSRSEPLALCATLCSRSRVLIAGKLGRN